MATIREASLADYNNLLPLFFALRRYSRRRHLPQDDDFEAVLAASRDYLREILERGPNALNLLAVTGEDSIAGYLIAVVNPPNPLTSSGAVMTAVIDELFVDSAHRGTGVASQLLEAAGEWRREQGALRLEVGAYAWNTEAIAFYERQGFEPWAITLIKEFDPDS